MAAGEHHGLFLSHAEIRDTRVLKHQARVFLKPISFLKIANAARIRPHQLVPKFPQSAEDRYALRTSMESVIIICDGDHIGDRLEFLLLRNELQKAQELSSQIREAIESVKARIAESRDFQLIFWGGDEICWAAANTSGLAQFLNSIRALFLSICGSTLSIGVGADGREASDALRAAKLAGRNRIYHGLEEVEP